MYSILEKTLILKSVELFQEIPGEMLSNIAQISDELSLEAEESIFMDGDYGDSLYIIIDGEVSIIKEKKEIALLGNGKCIGEMALLDQEPRSADAICITSCILLKIDQLGFYELMANNQIIMKEIIKLLTKRLRDTNKKLTSDLK
jgi:CRP-like cAMP-binding protein